MILAPRLTRSLEDQTCAHYAAPQKDPRKEQRRATESRVSVNMV